MFRLGTSLCRRLKPNGGIIKDDRAQALTEFVVVIPVIMLMFMLMYQYFVIQQISQLGNYAAYCAARVYAVRGSWDNDAMTKAQNAACLAMAPVSVTVPMGQNVIGLADEFLDDFSGGMPDLLEDAAKLAKGYAIAKYINFNEAITGGNIKITTSGHPKQVNVRLNYAYAVQLPGLDKMWELVGGEKDIKEDLKDMKTGLVWVPLHEATAYPFINIKSRCSMGYEEWNGHPRFRSRPGEAANADHGVDEKLEKRQRELEKARKAFNKDLEQEENACLWWQRAKEDENSAYDDYQAAMGTVGESVAESDWHYAKGVADGAWTNYTERRQDRMNSQDRMEELTDQSYGDIPQCPEP